jgi:solute carrier family 9B (sodium/hydrogen exchanger), member 1/2
LYFSAVVVPLLLALQEQGLGVAKGIPTLIIAASSVDDVLAISVFTITLGITFKPNTNIVAVVFQVSYFKVNSLIV